MQKTKLTICFDLDGTLVNSAPDLFAALDHALTIKGHPKSNHNEIRPIIGHGAKAMLKQALETNKVKFDDSELDTLWHILIDHYAIHIADQTHVFEGTIDALDTLKKQGHILAVCTNKTMVLTAPLLNKLGLEKYFSAITGADSFAFKKPDPRHLIKTIEQAGGNPQNALMIGDSKTDIDTAKNAGIPSIGVNWGYTDIPIADLGPDHLISHFNELPELVQRLTQNK